jgi:D-3-phosphoglycerate dehydrogenase / 2-oxoglutarate reductase
MSNLKVVVTDYIEPDLKWEEEECRKLGIDFSHYQLKTASTEKLLEVAADADVVVVNMARFDRKLIEGLRNTRMIIRHGIGYDNVDIAAATERGIGVGYIPDYCVPEVAEQALMLIMACQRKIFEQDRILRRSATANNWDFSSIYPVYRLQGKTVGIVGCGRIGSTVLHMLQGFGVNLLICDPFLTEDVVRKIGAPNVCCKDLLSESDIITVHVPLKKDTYHMFSDNQFKQMKNSAILVNTSRGAVIDLPALDRALREGVIAMAGIDVYEVEPPPADFPLLHNEKAICLPHLSWLSEESGWAIRQKIMENIRRFSVGQPPVNAVNPEVKIQFTRP